MAASPLNRFFSKSDPLARLQEHASRLLRLQNKVDLALPPAMRGKARVANLQDGELILHVSSPVMATRLKLGLESLKGGLLAAGEHVSSIKIKVRANPYQGNVRHEDVTARPIGRGGKAALQHLADELKPEDPLAKALRRMVDRSVKD